MYRDVLGMVSHYRGLQVAPFNGIFHVGDGIIAVFDSSTKNIN